MTAGAWAWLFVAATAGVAVFATLFHSVRDLTRAALEHLMGLRGPGPASTRAERILEDLEGHASAVAFPRVVCTVVSVVSMVFWLRGKIPPPADSFERS